MTRGKHGFPEGPADEFLLSDLVAATSALAGVPHYLQGWREAVIDSVERLTDERGSSRVPCPLFETTKNTARHLHQTITPFQGMLEAPRSISDVYQTHGRALRDLVVARDKVLAAVLEDLPAGVMDHLQDVTWRDLETLGAVHSSPQGQPGTTTQSSEPPSRSAATAAGHVIPAADNPDLVPSLPVATSGRADSALDPAWFRPGELGLDRRA
jgi:hypothetical protein